MDASLSSAITNMGTSGILHITPDSCLINEDAWERVKSHQRIDDIQVIIAHGNLQFLPTWLKIKELLIRSCFIYNLPVLSELTGVEIRNCNYLRCIPELPKLVSLRIVSCNYLAEIGNGPCIETVNVSQCPRLIHVPNWQKATKVAVTDCRVLHEVHEWPSATVIKVHGCNQIEEFPLWPSVKSLYIQNCSAPMRDWITLEEIYCLNYAGEIELGNWPNIQRIICHTNTTVESIPNYSTLRYLDCAGTAITEIPSLLNLKYLICSACDILELPSLPRLKCLCCHDTKISKLPLIPRLSTICYQPDPADYDAHISTESTYNADMDDYLYECRLPLWQFEYPPHIYPVICHINADILRKKWAARWLAITK